MTRTITLTAMTCALVWAAEPAYAQATPTTPKTSESKTSPSKTSPLTSSIVAASRGNRFFAISSDELKKAELAFVKTFKQSVSHEELKALWEPLGWDYSKLANGKKKTDSEIFILQESADQVRGRGIFAFRTNAKLSMAVQAPHCFYDSQTRRISISLFENQPVAAAAWNTVRRKIVDLAHHEKNYLNAFTRAFMQAQPKAPIVQIHGFVTSKRKTKAGKQSDVIVSNGTKFPGRIARAVSLELSNQLDEYAVRLYPADVTELGATTNSQGKLIHQHGFDSFLHIELNERIRQSLRTSQALRDRFNRCFRSSLPSLRAD